MVAFYSPFTIYHSRPLSRLLFPRARPRLALGLFGRDGRARLLRVELRLQLLGGRAREHELLVVEHVVDVYAARADDLRAAHVARGEHEVVVVNRVHDQGLPLDSERRQGADELFGLRPAEDELLDDDEVALAQALRKRRAQSAAAHLLRERLRPVARLRPVHVASALPQGRADRGDARAPRALLLPELAPRPGHV